MRRLGLEIPEEGREHSPTTRFPTTEVHSLSILASSTGKMWSEPTAAPAPTMSALHVALGRRWRLYAIAATAKSRRRFGQEHLGPRRTAKSCRHYRSVSPEHGIEVVANHGRFGIQFSTTETGEEDAVTHSSIDEEPLAVCCNRVGIRE